MEPNQREIRTGGGDYREIHNRGIYAEGNIYLTSELFAALNRPRTEKLLLQQVGAEIYNRLRQLLHNQILINLEKEEQVDLVKRPWDYEVKVGDHHDEKLDSDITIQQVFDRSDIQSRLLILGQPGSGKTTTLLDLAKFLLNKAQDSNELIPVLVNLAAWDHPERSIPDWLAEELKAKYGLRSDTAKKLLQEQKLLPLLDGLDEVKSSHQQACVKALNQWINGDAGYSVPSQLVVCSRIEEYEQIDIPLQLNGAIRLLELSEQQIEDYLGSIGRSHLLSLFSQAPVLKELGKIPLFLSMVVIADKLAPGELQVLQGASNAQSLLMDIYVREMLKNAEPYTPRQMKVWLIWLAQQLQRKSQPDFLIEKIHLFLNFSVTNFKQYTLRVTLTFGIILWVSFLPPCWWIFIEESILEQIFALIVLAIVAWLVAESISSRKFHLIDCLSWSWAEAIGALGGLIMIGLIFGLALGVFFAVGLTLMAVVNGESENLRYVLLVFLISPFMGAFVLLMFGLGLGVRIGLTGQEIERKIFVNQGVWNSLKLGFLEILIYGLSYGVMFGLVGKLFNSPWGVLPDGLVGGLIFGLFFGLLVGEIVALFGSLGGCLKHFILRWVLYNNGFIPWNYSRFLNRCTDCLLLQRVGGRFRFIHKIVQEHFAAMEFKRP